MKRVLIILCLLVVFLTGCKKDASEKDPTPIPQEDYMQLKIGNYWVYEMYRVDSSGNENPTGQSDSSIIISDTIIASKLYYKLLSSKGSYVSYLHDSNGYLVDLEGKVLFSDHDFTNILRIDTIGPGLAYIEYKMQDHDTVITAPIGTYPTLEFRGKVIPLNPQSTHGVNYTHYFYAEGLGKIKSESYYFSAPHLKVGQRLIEFGNLEVSNP